ncbi:MAG: hypothetical protein EA341_12560 [Mongoliibacter sp.]|uniref:hypothetical protein n=1 Tax=Mongoliibacter sp. TaxID=2022438 RepID=UPI0012F3D902|nr:hypothetical protein [Mongoliibacter sp.]TVP47492.1 MAG: hypothetical protein EA341_12560 [Mongoliibacter sp.]
MEKFLYLTLNILTGSFALVKSYISRIQYAENWCLLLQSFAFTLLLMNVSIYERINALQTIPKVKSL